VKELFTAHDVQDEGLFFRDAVEEAQGAITSCR
jgi:hypothetical protein